MKIDFEKAYTQEELRVIQQLILDTPTISNRRDSLDRIRSNIKAARFRPLTPKPESSLGIVLNRLMLAHIDIEDEETIGN